MKQRKVMKFNKPKIKTKQNVDKESFSMNVDEYVRITRKNTNYKSGFTTKTIYLRQPQYYPVWFLVRQRRLLVFPRPAH